MLSAVGDVNGVDAPAAADLGRWQRRLPMLALGLGIVIFGVLAGLCWTVSDQNEQRLLQRQADQASAVLSVSIGQVRGPLDGAARAAAATNGDPATFDAIAAPLLGDAGGYAALVLYDIDAATPIAAVGAAPRLSSSGSDAPAAMLATARTEPFVVVDLLAQNRTIGYASSDDTEDPHFVVYAERTLSPDPNVRRRSDEPFAQLEYALYLGGESTEHLLGASVRDLPIEGRRATTLVPYGNEQILLVATPIDRLGGWLMNDLWWIVVIGGVIVSGVTFVLLRRLNHSREQAVGLAAENARKHREQRDIAEMLQLSLLPQRLTPPAGASLAARYWPAGSANLIGGDFYDAFRIDDEHWGVVIGDVCGKGIEAAALTGLVRHTIRTASRHGDSPSTVLRAVHVALTEHEPRTFCTVCLIVFAPRQLEPGLDAVGGGELTIALGGHPQPLLGRRGHVVPVGRLGTILGMVEPVVVDTTVGIEPGDTLLLFTDGLTDAPGDQAVPLSEIEDLLSPDDPVDVDHLADAIRARKRRRRPEGSSDDTALLVIRFGEDRPLRPERPWASGSGDAAPIPSTADARRGTPADQDADDADAALASGPSSTMTKER